jgi:myosin III
MDTEERLKDFSLETGRHYRYLRVPDKFIKSNLDFVRDDTLGNPLKFKDFEQALLTLDISPNILESIYKVFAAILILGEIRFKDSESDRKAALVETENAKKISTLLGIDEKKFQWALVNYCIVCQGNVEKRRLTTGKIFFKSYGYIVIPIFLRIIIDEARDARDVLAGTLYTRLVDFIINTINHKLAFNRAIL